MDKYEYKLKTEQMLEFMEDGSYSRAAEIADSIDWKRVRNTTMLMNVSDIYEKSGEYQKSYEVLNIAYHRAEGSRKIVYRLCTLALKTKNFEEAIDYYDDFLQLAPKDPNQYILKYQILRAQRAPIEQQIDALESFKKAEYIEAWAYELAKLYQEAGMIEECLEECDDIILWFSEGKYVYKAMEMKMQYKPLTPSQKEKYDRRFDKGSTETEEMPDLSAFMKKKEASAEEVQADLEKQLEESLEEQNQLENEKKGRKKNILKSEPEEAEELPEEQLQNMDTEIMPVIAEEQETAADQVIEESQLLAEKAAEDSVIIEGTVVTEKTISDDIEKNDTEPGKKKIGQTMKLDEALRVLLSPDSKERENAGLPEEEVEEDIDLSDLEDKIEDIESVADLNMVRERQAEKDRRSSKVDADLEELTADPMLPEEEQEERMEEESARESGIETSASAELEWEELALDEEDAEELELDEEDAEDMLPDEEDAEDMLPDEEEMEDVPSDEENPEGVPSDEEDIDEPTADEIADGEQFEEAISAVTEDRAGDNAENEKQQEEPQTHSGREESMDNNKKKNEPILPPDIQRLIDEIEGVIPPEEEKPKRTRRASGMRERTKKDNMGRVTERLRLDEIGEELELLDDESEEDEFYEEEYNEADLYLEGENDNVDGYSEEEYGDADEYLEEEYSEDEYPEEEYEAAEEYYEDENDDADEYSEEEYEEADEYPEEEYEEYEEADEYPEEEYEEADEYPEEEYEEADEYAEEEYEEADEYAEEEYEEADEYAEEEYEEADEYAEEYEEADEYDEYDDRFYSAEDALADMEEEFRPHGFAADEPDDREIDDREISDDEDDDTGVNFLTASVPLSRKETAKMIATGKTAPIPSDEIADALSISDTGFLVHSSRELVTPEGKKHVALTDEQKKLFSYFVPVRGMSEQLVDVLEQDKNCTNRKGTSRTGNLLVIGNKGNGKTVLAVDVVKAIQKQRRIKQGKVAIVTGEALNKKKVTDIFRKLHGGALIIEKAGKLNEKTVAKLNKAMEQDTGELLIVLEDQRKPLDRLLTSNREFRRKFTSRLEVPVFINDELVTFGQTYAQENGYRIDEMGLLALYSRIDVMQREDHSVTITEVKEVMDEAMDHSQKASAKKLMKRVFGKNTDDADRIILTEKDFNV